MEEKIFNIGEIADEVSCEVADAVEDAVYGALESALPDALRACFAELLQSKPRTMVLSNDKTKYISC